MQNILISKLSVTKNHSHCQNLINSLCLPRISHISLSVCVNDIIRAETACTFLKEIASSIQMLLISTIK